MTEELEQLLHNLRLYTVAERFDAHLTQAEADGLPVAKLLATLLRDEWHARQEQALKRRLQRARLPEICDLAEAHEAMVLVDESHATGFTGPTGRGTHEKFGVMDRVDLITTTLGKALGGALGGATAGPGEVIEWLRQKSRPYLFSNSLAPVIVMTAIKAFDMITEQKTGNQRELKQKLTDDEVRALLAELKRVADEEEIPDEPFEVNMAEEFRKAIDRALEGTE